MMGSKYDAFWEQRIGEIFHLIIAGITPLELDIKDITSFGERESWSGNVEIRANKLFDGRMAHLKSLGNTILNQKDERLWGLNLSFQVTNDLILKINKKQQIGETQNNSLFNLKDHSRNDHEDILLNQPEQNHNEKVDYNQIVDELYLLVEELHLFDSTYNPKDLPENGIYFIYEKGQQFESNGKTRDRIVRIGTHRENKRFRDRIRNHFRGTIANSVFRQHVNTALTLIEGVQPNERHISEVFEQYFTFRCISVETKTERLKFEQRLISLLAHFNYLPSESWLGKSALSYTVSQSGLWNVQHVNNLEYLNRDDLKILKRFAIPPTQNEYNELFNLPFVKQNVMKKILCFIPCCSFKEANGQIVPNFPISRQSLLSDNTWNNLVTGRGLMTNALANNSPLTSSIFCYKGSPYRKFDVPRIVDAITNSQIQLLVISAGYGVINALEPINDYDAEMKGEIACIWSERGLENVIAEYIQHEKPDRVFGFFAGEVNWNNARSMYRYFFTQGLQLAIENGFDPEICGCFYREEGRGAIAILNALGITFNTLFDSNFSDDCIDEIERVGLAYQNVLIGFDRF